MSASPDVIEAARPLTPPSDADSYVASCTCTPPLTSHLHRHANRLLHRADDGHVHRIPSRDSITLHSVHLLQPSPSGTTDDLPRTQYRAPPCTSQKCSRLHSGPGLTPDATLIVGRRIMQLAFAEDTPTTTASDSFVQYCVFRSVASIIHLCCSSTLGLTRCMLFRRHNQSHLLSHSYELARLPYSDYMAARTSCYLI